MYDQSETNIAKHGRHLAHLKNTIGTMERPYIILKYILKRLRKPEVVRSVLNVIGSGVLGTNTLKEQLSLTQEKEFSEEIPLLTL